MNMFQDAKFGDKYNTNFGVGLFLKRFEQHGKTFVVLYIQNFGEEYYDEEGHALKQIGEYFDVTGKIPLYD